jgi:D-glycero-alpha-D-manno-heptose-7-phosphate kinase
MSQSASAPRIVNSRAPVRICDNGGWSDTWFARYGCVFNVAVSPCVEVQIIVEEHGAGGRVTIHAENDRVSYSIPHPAKAYVKYPLLEACVDFAGVPEDLSIGISVFSEVPAGCSTGTSAAVSVALIAALDRLAFRHRTPAELASAAHRVETEYLRQQSGIQDQIASAWGGINFIRMTEYPSAEVTQLQLAEEMRLEFEQRLALVFLGRSHSSSAVHEKVIRALGDSGPDDRRLTPIRAAAEHARDALLAADFNALGRSMIACTEAQRNLHPELVGARHQAVIDIAADHGAIGWKVNGAGGDGGSVTLLTGPNRRRRRLMLEEIARTNPEFLVIPICLSEKGAQTWVSEPRCATLAQ